MKFKMKKKIKFKILTKKKYITDIKITLVWSDWKWDHVYSLFNILDFQLDFLCPLE